MGWQAAAGLLGQNLLSIVVGVAVMSYCVKPSSESRVGARGVGGGVESLHVRCGLRRYLMFTN